MALKLLRAAMLASLLLAGSVPAATLTVTPDKSTYLVGETITLSVLGDAEGASDNRIFGRLLFAPELATFVAASQEPLTSLGGLVTWSTGDLGGGVGFADAFSQGPGSVNPFSIDGPLRASVTLLASASGILEYTWETTSGVLAFDFFSLTSAPGGSVTIVPEPATGLLLAVGLVTIALATRRRRS